MNMNLVPKVRFDALAAYCRDPLVSVVATELAWLASADERALATLVLDTDGQYPAHILAPDLRERYRWIAMTGYFASPEEALVDLEQSVDSLLPTLDEERQQGDEKGPPVDFFEPVRPTELLNPDFVTLATEKGFRRGAS